VVRQVAINVALKVSKTVEGIANMDIKEQAKDWEPEKIRKAITSKGLPIEELARLWGVPKSSIYRCMSNPAYQNCEPYIANYIGFPIDVVFAGRVAERQERADRRAKARLEATALVERQVV
jgi:lambda repressor-like predicted transcriptional regulator